MGASDILALQLAGHQRGAQMISDFASNMRMKGIANRFMRSGISTPQQFQQFAAENSLTIPETATLLKLVDAQKDAFAQSTPYSSAAGVGIYDQRTGQVTQPYNPGYGSSAAGIYDKGSGQVVRPTYQQKDWYRINPDGSIESRKSKSQAEENVFVSQGFERGSYREKALGSPSSSSGKSIKTWVLPNGGGLYHAPSDVKPPPGSKPWSESGAIMQRMMVSQEVSALEMEKRQIRREIDNIKRLPNIEYFDKQRDRIPDLQTEISDLDYRLNELRNKGNDLNPRPQPEPAQAPDLSMLPPPSSVKKGTKMVWEPTGDTWISDGNQWVKQ